jgi:peptidoglycan/LPS O-acetylase OafA/YrhL
MTVPVWRQGVPRALPAVRAPGALPAPGAQRAPFRQRIANWRARNWRRIVLAWFVVTLALMAVAAEPGTDFPKAQASAVPAVGVALLIIDVLTLAGVPALLIALP